MSKRTTVSVVACFMTAKEFNTANALVEVLPNVTVLKLYGNEIAYRYNDPERTLSITNSGYKTATTKEHLNEIEGVSIQQKKGIWYLNGTEWDGSLIDVPKAG